MNSVWDNRFYKSCLIRLQPEERNGGWIPRCTILYTRAGSALSESLAFEKARQPTREEAGQYAFDRAKEWIDQNAPV